MSTKDLLRRLDRLRDANAERLRAYDASRRTTLPVALVPIPYDGEAVARSMWAFAAISGQWIERRDDETPSAFQARACDHFRDSPFVFLGVASRELLPGQVVERVEWDVDALSLSALHWLNFGEQHDDSQVYGVVLPNFLNDYDGASMRPAAPEAQDGRCITPAPEVLPREVATAPFVSTMTEASPAEVFAQRRLKLGRDDT